MPESATEETIVAGLPDGLVAVGKFLSPSEASERGLVILAMGLPYWLMAEPHRFTLFVESDGEPAVRDQLARFECESVGWPPAPVTAGGTTHGLPMVGPLLWALSAIASLWIQQWRPVWTDFGALDAAALFGRAEWWRPATALFLHSDTGHLVSNLATGLFVFTAVLATFGRRVGWLLLALTSAGGNLASAALHHPALYRSVGASTAIFAGLGLLTGRAIPLVRNSPHPFRWRSLLVPVGAGLTLLALYGAGGPRVDLGAHVCGFASGLLGGLASGFLRVKSAQT